MPVEEEIVESLSSFPRYLAQVASRIPAAKRTQSARGGGFCWSEHVCHLRDFENEGVLIRIERILTEDEPALVDFDGKRLAAERDYRAQDAEAALAGFERARAQTAQRVKALSDSELARTARFGQEGVITMRRLIAMALEHDADHRQEIEGLLCGLQLAGTTRSGKTA